MLGRVSCFVDFLQEQMLLWTGWYRVLRGAWFEGEKARYSWKEFNFSVIRELIASPRARFSKLPKLSGFLAKTFPGVKFCYKFALSYLEIIVKGQLSRMSGSQFFKWLFGLGKFTGLSRKIRELLILRTVIRESFVNFRENRKSNGNSWSINCFYISTETYFRNESDENYRSV